MAGRIGEQKIRCSFCNKSEDQVRKLIAGPNDVYICDDCIEICSEIIEEELSLFLSGQNSAEKTVNYIQNRVSIYLSEKE